jgi:phosphodiesterase/alkaline phosphatase D-like protein
MKRINRPSVVPLVLLAMLASAAPAAAALARGPYVQMGHFTNQATIVWRTDAAADGAVDYGLTTDYGATAVGGSGYQHEIALTGLLPGTTYYYRVRSGGATLATASFRSGKAPGSAFRIGLFSDTHQGGCAAIGNLLALAEPDLLLAIGDMTDDGLYSDLDNNLFSKMGAVLASAPLYWTPATTTSATASPPAARRSRSPATNRAIRSNTPTP